MTAQLSDMVYATTGLRWWSRNTLTLYSHIYHHCSVTLWVKISPEIHQSIIQSRCCPVCKPTDCELSS